MKRKDVRRIVRVLALLVVGLVIYFSVYYGYFWPKRLQTEPTAYTVATIDRFFNPTDGGTDVYFTYIVNKKSYQAFFPKYGTNVRVGEKYFVLFEKNDPLNSDILLDAPVPHSITNVPKQGWDGLPYGSKECPDQYCDVYGTWRIIYIAFADPPHGAELDEIIKGCKGQKIIIDPPNFTFTASNCFLYKSITNFRIKSKSVLTYEIAMKRFDLSEKAVLYLFEDGKRNIVEEYKTNYDFVSDEGEVPELDIFMLDKDNIIINQHGNIVSLVRE